MWFFHFPAAWLIPSSRIVDRYFPFSPIVLALFPSAMLWTMNTCIVLLLAACGTVAAQSHPSVIGDGATSATECENVQRCKILDCVHSLAKRHVGRQVHNSCPASLRVIKVPLEVFDARAQTFCRLASLWQVHFGVR